MNEVSLIGHIVRDISLTTTKEGKKVLNNSIAVDRIYRSESGQTADFIPFTAWGKTAELLSEYCRKGDQVALTGRLQSRSYSDQGEKRYVVELIADRVYFLKTQRTRESQEEISGIETRQVVSQ